MTAKSRFSGSVLLPVFMVFAIIVLSACAPSATQAPEPQAPEAPVEPSDQYPVQYGQDTRMEPYQHSDSRLKEMAGSVAIFVHRDRVQVSGNSVQLDGHTLSEMSEMGWLVSGASLPMCADELFTSQPAPGFCTGFLVTEDILVTAGHCLQKTPCVDSSIVFGFQMEAPGGLAEISKDDLFECKTVVRQVLPGPENHSLDYALIKLDRPSRRAGLPYSKEDRLKAQDNVAVLGYPSGLPQKIASNAYVLSNKPGDPFFVANLDTFGSNSGSPVINMDTYQVEGILVSGMTDYVLSEDGSCVQVNRCPEGGDDLCSGENATKMVQLAAAIQESMAGDAKQFSCYHGLLLVVIIITLGKIKLYP